MAGFMEKIGVFLGIEDADIGDDIGDESYYDEPVRGRDNVTSFGARKRPAQSDNVVSLPTAGQMKVIVYHPIGYEDTQSIIDNLKSRKPVIVNMEELDIECAQRILDFMAGAVYALNGTISKIARGIFLVAPTNYDVIANGDTDPRGIV